ncbi:MAG: pitrilysin family protein [Gemmatimonadota bacterium]
MQIQLPFSSFTLRNGLQLIVHEDHSVPIAAVNLWYRVGSKDERPGRTGFAHLFEHLMFEGSANVPQGQFDELLEVVGGINNGSTSTDRTNYWETVPSAACELALFLEADRMGSLPDAMTQAKLDAQRDVVKNERRQSYENRPYGLAFETMHAALYPSTHPYHWPIIGWMPDLDAATLSDVNAFFRRYYVPNNASLCVAGDVDAQQIHELAEKYFGPIPPAAPPAPVSAPLPALSASRASSLEDDVHLPRVYIAWHSPAMFETGDAELDVLGAAMSQGKNARLYRSLVYQNEWAQDVQAFQSSALLGSTFNVVVTARPGIELDRLVEAVWSELRAAARDLERIEVQRAVNRFETSLVDSLQTVGGFGGRADRLNHYAFYLNDPDGVQRDLDRYRRIEPDAVMQAAHTTLLDASAITLTVLPRARTSPLLVSA